MAKSELPAYPTDMSEAVSVLLRKVRGSDEITLNEGVHAAYVVQGVCLANLLPVEPLLMSGRKSKAKEKAAEEAKAMGDEWDRPEGMKCEYPDEDECCQILESAEAACKAPKGASDGNEGILDNPMFKQLLGVALSVLQQWLAKK